MPEEAESKQEIFANASRWNVGQTCFYELI